MSGIQKLRKFHVVMTHEERLRLKVACAAATGVMEVVGPQDPVAQRFLAVARSYLPVGWDIPGWHEGTLYCHDTVSNFNTRLMPDCTAGVLPPRGDSPTLLGPVPPPPHRVSPC